MTNDKLIDRLSEAQALYGASGLHGENGAKIMKDAKARILADAEALKAADELERLLRRYFTETPLGHQPHMIDEDTQKALAAYSEKRGERE